MITVLIDYDDTLSDTRKVFVEKLDGFLGMDGDELWNIFLHKVHRDLIENQHPEWHENLEAHTETLLQYLDAPNDQTLKDDFMQRYVEADQETWAKPKFFPDTIRFLVEVKVRGHRLCLTTGPHAAEKAAALEKAAGKKLFYRVFGEDTLGVLKKNPEYFRLVLKETGAKPEQTICLGDTLTHDIKPTSALGIKTIWINRKHEVNRSAIKPDLEVEDLMQALNTLNLRAGNKKPYNRY
jgi:HAD superfamily hydrolase (TIGR01549 family)